MRILLITEFFPDLKDKKFSGGVEARTFFVAQNLAKKHTVTVICRRKTGEKKLERSKNLDIIRLGGKTKDFEAKFTSIFPRAWFIIQSIFYGMTQHADLVEGSNFICLPSAWIISKLKKIPAIAWYPDIYGREWIKNFGFLTGFFGLVLEKIGLMLSWSTVIALSQQTKKKLINKRINKEKITVVYGGVDSSYIKSVKAARAKKPTICCISRLVPYKNVDCLLGAVKIIKKEIPDIRCTIIGKGPEKEKLIKLTSELEIRKNITYKENLSYEEVIRNLKSSWVFCLPSRIEGFGLVTIEALAAGVPFVIAENQINKEITEGKGGLFFKHTDENDLSKKINRLLASASIRKKLILQGSALLENYSWVKIGRQTEKIYKSVI